MEKKKKEKKNYNLINHLLGAKGYGLRHIRKKMSHILDLWLDKPQSMLVQFLRLIVASLHWLNKKSIEQEEERI